MKYFHPNGVIRIKGEKNGNPGSKGSRQWQLLKQFDGKSVEDFERAAKLATESKPHDTYQKSNWWTRELDYCWTHKVISVEEDSCQNSSPLSTSKTEQFNLQGKAVYTDRTGVSGIYVVTLLSDELVPVTQDSRYVATCAQVNAQNVKVGKARDFDIRKRNYWKDFGTENVTFLPIVKTADIQAAETIVLRELKSFRKRSPKGGLMDWLENIGQEQVISLIFLALTKAQIPYEPLWESSTEIK